jgi:hypothetical protein
VTVLALHLVLLNVNDVAEVDRLIWLVAPSSLRRTEVMEMVPDIEIPESGLAVIKNARTNTDLGII